MKSGSQSRTRFVNLTEISNVLGPDVSSCLPRMHAFTGCDSVSAFAGKGKVAAPKLLRKFSVFHEAFVSMRQQNEISAELLKHQEAFTCSLYGSKTITDINQLRYAMFCAKRGKIESHQLPLCIPS